MSFGQKPDSLVLRLPFSSAEIEMNKFATTCTECADFSAIKSKEQTWLRLIVDNRKTQQQALNLILEKPINFIEIFSKTNDSLNMILKIEKQKMIVGTSLWQNKNWLRFPLKNGIDTLYFLANKFDPKTAKLYSGSLMPYQSIESHFAQKEPKRWFFFFIAGFSVLMMVSLLVKSAVNNWEKANLYCSMMFLCSFLNVICWANVIDFPNFPVFNAIPIGRLGLIFNQLTPVFMLLLYREFLNIRVNFFLLSKFMTVAIYVLFICNAGIFYSFFDKNTFEKIPFENIFEVVLLVVELYLPFAFLRFRKHPIYRFATWSSWIIAGSFIAYFIIFRGGYNHIFALWFDPAYLMFIALMIDGFLFLTALTLRERQIVVEKMAVEQQAISNELRALRSQMNPHFIFNSLNSIKSFTLNNDAESANFYLTKFSKLIRQVLDNSRNEKIPLKNEIETLTLYMDMEKLRVGDKFDYEINVNEDAEIEFIEIPPMLIQPYIENAIWHGLMPKETKGKVKINILQEEKYLKISIEDNGIGREKAAKLQSMEGNTHKSFGMKITNERLDILKQLNNIDAKVLIEDLKDNDGNASGTKVILAIPI